MRPQSDDVFRVVYPEDLRALPACAIAAFAARCASRVLPLLYRAWPDAPEPHLHTVSWAVAHAELSAESGLEVPDAMRITHAAAAAAAAAPAGPARLAALAARSAVVAGAMVSAPGRDAEDNRYVAAEAAFNASQSSVHACREYAVLAGDGEMAAFTARDNARAAARADLERLTALTSRDAGTSARATVNLADLGPLWPDGLRPAWDRRGPLKIDMPPA